jgi:hypothetical protein
VELYIHSPNTPSWRGFSVKKEAQGQLYLYLPPRQTQFPTDVTHLRNVTTKSLAFLLKTREIPTSEHGLEFIHGFLQFALANSGIASALKQATIASSHVIFNRSLAAILIFKAM